MLADNRKLKLWEALALSLGMMGPTLAMSGNAQGLIESVGPSLPLVFIMSFVGVCLVAYGFVRLTGYFNHTGSAYALVSMTVGPRWGFLAGFAIFGGYLSFSVGTLAAFGAFTNAFLLEISPDQAHPMQLPWIIIALIGIAGGWFFNNRDSHVVVRALMLIEGIGIALMLILAAVIISTGHSSHAPLGDSLFSLKGVSLKALMGGIVAAFLSWAGFEACASLGEETNNPYRNIPLALLGSVILTGILFVVMMYVQLLGFGTDIQGLTAFKNSANSLGSLATEYVGSLYGLMILFVSMLAAFACHLSASATASRILSALARDGFISKKLSTLHPHTLQPRNALLLIAIVDIILGTLTWSFGAPDGSNTAIGSYFYFGIVGSVCLMVAYLMVEIGAMAFALRGKTSIPRWETIIPLAGSLVVVVSLYFNLEGGALLGSSFTGIAWCTLGLIIILLAPRLARNIGTSFAREFAREANEREAYKKASNTSQNAP